MTPSHRRRALAAAAVWLLASLAIPSNAVAAEEVISLAGRWRLALDRQDVGVGERWFERFMHGRIRLPGSLPAHGIGDPVTTNTSWTGGIVDRSWFTAPEYERYRQTGNVKVPFWLQPETYYAGVAWYQRDVVIPADARNLRWVLFLERPHWETRVWIDDRFVGTANALGTPHEHELGTLGPGRHRLTIRVDNRMVIDIGENSHSISDHTQGNWNGIVGRIELRGTPKVWIDDLQVFPDVVRKSVRLRGHVGNRTGAAGSTPLAVAFEIVEPGIRRPTAATSERSFVVEWGPDGGDFDQEFALGAEAPLWDEFRPVLIEVTARLQSTGHAVVRRFGLREFRADGTQFAINGRRTFLRGTLECSIFPRTGHPPTDVPSWRQVMTTVKAHGLNHLRFHSHCPPEAAFVAADELGVFLQVEASSWANQSTSLGDGKPVDAWIYQETDRILRYYGNHPSFVLMPYGNEPGGGRHQQYLAAWVEHYRAKDSRRLWTAGAGWPQLPENEWHLTPDPRIQGWGQGLASRINGRPPETLTDYRAYIAERKVPVVSHEIGQWCVYPNFDEIRKYTGYLEPRNFEIFRDRLAAAGMAHLARPFLRASGKLQTLCYKEDIESALRTPGMAGFQLLDLHDFPGQGTALVGVLDPFWEEKGYVTPAEFRRFSGPTVPLARLAKRVFTVDETPSVDLEVAHFGPSSIDRTVAEWRLVDDAGVTVVGESLGTFDLPTGQSTRLGTPSLPLASLPAPARYRLVVGLNRTGIANDWDLWVYPSQVPTEVPPNVAVRRELDAEALEHLTGGGRLILLVPPNRVRPDPKTGPVALGFSSIFWNTAWTGRQPPHTLGILCDPRHPLFESFPTDSHSNWQWWYLVTRAGALRLDELPRDLRPTVQVIDDWVTARKLALVFEARVGAGRLLVCSIELEGDLSDDPVRRQFRHGLFRYVASEDFRPKVEVTADQVRSLFD